MDYNEICKIRNDLQDILVARKLLDNLRVLKKEVPKFWKMSITDLENLIKQYTREMVNLAKSDKGLREAIGSNLLV